MCLLEVHGSIYLAAAAMTAPSDATNKIRKRKIVSRRNIIVFAICMVKWYWYNKCISKTRIMSSLTLLDSRNEWLFFITLKNNFSCSGRNRTAEHNSCRNYGVAVKEIQADAVLTPLSNHFASRHTAYCWDKDHGIQKTT